MDTSKVEISFVNKKLCLTDLVYCFVLAQRDATYQMFSGIYEIKSHIKLQVHYDEGFLC